jgi:putative acetyltransferase
VRHRINYIIRHAVLADVDDIAAAHLDSIRSLGARYYEADVVDAWCANVAGDLYANAMARGEIFFVAAGEIDGPPAVLGFSSHKILNGEHRTAVYVRGRAARLGIGSALFKRANAEAITAGATSIRVDASLAAVEFYKANGFEEISTGEFRLRSGRTMPFVLMKKPLRT